MRLRIKHLKPIADIFFLLFSFFVFVIVIIYGIYSSSQKGPLSKEGEAESYIAEANVSSQSSVESRVTAEKLDLERKIISPKVSASKELIENEIKEKGGKILESKGNLIVASIPKIKEKQITESLIQAGSVQSVEIDYPTFLTADDPDWGTARIEAPPVWTTTTAEGVRIAVVDTGIDYSHQDLASRYGGGYDTFNQDSNPFDDHGHGTHVSGIIAADLNGVGLAGVSPKATILAVKALGADGTGYISDVVEAIDWAIDNQASIINFSLGTTYNSNILADKLDQAASRGVVLVAAAGNTNGGSLLYPAAYGNVISVSATDSSDQFASFSSVGAEISAPGVSVNSTIPGNGYAAWSGTSMAAPHVTATAALMLSNGQVNIRESLHNTAVDLGPPGVDNYFGYGLVHAKPAALGEDVLAPIVTFISPENNSEVSGDVEVALSAQDESDVKSVRLFINGEQVVNWTEPPYIYGWNTASYPPGKYQLVAQAIDEWDNQGEAQISVTVSQVIEPTVTPTVSLTPTPSSPSLTTSPTLGLSPTPWADEPTKSLSPTPSSAPTLTKQMGKSEDVRKDYEHKPLTPPGQSKKEKKKQEMKDHLKEEAEKKEMSEMIEKYIPEVTNLHHRNPKPKKENLKNTNRGNIKGVRTNYFLDKLVLFIYNLLP